MQLQLRVLVEHHPDSLYTASVLGLPEHPDPREARDRLPRVSILAGFGDDLEAIEAGLAKEAARRISRLEPAEVAAWRLDPEPELATVEVPVEADDALGRTLDAVLVPFTVLVTRFPSGPHAVFVPRLGIRLAVEEPERALAAAAAEIAACLRRRPELRTLRALAAFHAAEETHLTTIQVEAPARSPLQGLDNERLKTEQAEADRKRSEDEVLESVATDLVARASKLAPAHEHEAAVAQVLEFLQGDSGRGLLLVGPSGAGKTAAIHEAVRRLARGAGRHRVFETSGSRLVAGMTMFGQWQERCRAVVAALGRSGGALCVGDPHELLENGQAVGFDVSIAQYLKRPIEEGKLRVLAECTEEAHAALERTDQGFAGLFRVVRVPESDRARTLAVLAAVAAEHQAKERARFDRAGLERVYELLARFAPYAAFPGKGVRFLERLASPRSRPDLPTLGRAEVTRAFAAQTGLPVAILDDQTELDPDAVRGFLSERVLGQRPATDRVADSVLRIKAGLADPRRPLGSFLFLGPTGTGKTETAKVLAEFLFGSRDRLVRIDMTEYQDPLAAVRLAGGPDGEGEGDLTRAVRAEPFSVLLLDEVEKAHPSVFDLLLQVLGEARLTDARGRVTDYRSAIVLLTSNLGAELPEGSPGFGASAGRDRFLDAALAFFRPELVNRLDAIVPFAALGPDVIRRIARRELDRALGRDGLLRRGTTVEVAPELEERVVAAGYHPRYGARPLKRAVEDLVVRPIALALAGTSQPPRRLRVVLDEDGAASVVVALGPLPARGVEIRTAKGAAPVPRKRRKREAEAEVPIAAEPELPTRLRVHELVERLAAQRRAVGEEAQGDLAVELRDEVRTLRTQIAREDSRRASRKRSTTDLGRERARLSVLEEALGALESVRRETDDLEELCLSLFLADDEESVAAAAPAVAKLAREAASAAIGLRATRFDAPDAALVVLAPVRGEESLVVPLARVYVDHATERGWSVVRYGEGREPEKAKAKRLVPVWKKLEALPGETDAFVEPPSPSGAFALLVEGKSAAVFLAAEPGLHRRFPVAAGVPLAVQLATVSVTPLAGSRGALSRVELQSALVRAHTVTPPPETAAEKKSAEKAAKGKKKKKAGQEGEEREKKKGDAGLPLLSRVYDERSGTIADPRTGVSLEASFAEAASTVADFARSWLLRAEGGAP